MPILPYFITRRDNPRVVPMFVPTGIPTIFYIYPVFLSVFKHADNIYEIFFILYIKNT
jgi:hypothetical protein